MVASPHGGPRNSTENPIWRMQLATMTTRAAGGLAAAGMPRVELAARYDRQHGHSQLEGRRRREMFSVLRRKARSRAEIARLLLYGLGRKNAWNESS